MPSSVFTIHDLAATVRGRRKTLHLSQAEVARRAGVSRQWVNEFEAGKPTAELHLVLRLLDALALELSLETRDLTPGESNSSDTDVVDLDALLAEYRAP